MKVTKTYSYYRGKSEDSGRWVFGDLYCFWEDTYILTPFVGNPPDMIVVIPETTCQCTGMLSNVGVKIFEADIIRYGNGRVGFVYFNREIGAFCVTNGSEMKDDDDMLSKYTSDDYGLAVELLGNVYDTPSLLNSN